MINFLTFKKALFGILILAICFPLMRYSSYLLIIALSLGLFLVAKQKRWRFCKISPTQIVFVVILVFEMSYSLQNLDKRLSVYLPLLLFPILLSSFDISTQNIISIWKSFVLLLFGTLLTGFALALSKSEYNITNLPFFLDLSTFTDFHRIYLSMYCLMGLCLSYLILIDEENLKEGSKYIYGFMAIFFAIMVFLLNARLGVIYLVGWIIYLLFIKIKDFKKYRLFYIFAIIILIIGAKYSYSDDDVRERFQSMTTDPRIVIIESSLTLIQEKPLIGYGIKEGLQKLHNLLQKNGIPFNYNCHNQFLQYQLYYGIIGTLVFLFLIGHFIYISIKTKHFALLFFIGMIFLFCGIESILERQRGVVLFAFFYNLYYFNYKQLAIKKNKLK